MDSLQYKKYGGEMVEYIANYLETIRERKVYPDVSPGYMSQLIPKDAPHKGESWENIIADVERVVMPGLTHWQSPHMHGYFPATLSYPSLLGDMLADGINALGFTWASSPASTELEVIVTNWLGKAIGLPDEFLHHEMEGDTLGGGGVLQTNASEATFVAMLAARTEAINRERLSNKSAANESDGSIVSRLVAYTSEEGHSSIEKAGLMSLVKVKHLATDENYSLRGATLKEAIIKDREQGLLPFYVCASLGTTSCSSFDRLDELGPVCEEENIWLHVDAAYAGSAFICPEFRHFLSGVECAQSFVFNPSKWLLVNFDCTALWVKRSDALHSTFGVTPLYLRHTNNGDVINYMNWQPFLSRRFRALKLWFVMRSYGIEGLQEHIRYSVGLGKYFEDLVRKDERFEIPAKRHLGLIVFRLKGENEKSEKLLANLNKTGKIHMVPAIIKNIYVIRFTVTSPRTTKEDLEADWKLIQEETAKLLSVGSPEITTHGLNENITPTSDISLADALTSKLDEKLEEKPDSGLRTAAGIKPGRMPLGLLPHRMLKEIEKLNAVEKYYLIPNSARVEEKQEINGHYGVEG